MAPFFHADSGSSAGTQVCRFHTYIQPLEIAKARLAAGIPCYLRRGLNLHLRLRLAFLPIY